jgi:hypothetical protein
MRILLDECVPWPMHKLLLAHDCVTASIPGDSVRPLARQKLDVVNKTRNNPALSDRRGQFTPEFVARRGNETCLRVRHDEPRSITGSIMKSFPFIFFVVFFCLGRLRAQDGSRPASYELPGPPARFENLASGGSLDPEPDTQSPFFEAARRALRRAAKKVHAENRKLGLPIIIWRNGKVVSAPP